MGKGLSPYTIGIPLKWKEDGKSNSHSFLQARKKEKKSPTQGFSTIPPPVFPSKANACLLGWQEGPLDTVSAAGPRATQHRPGLATGREELTQIGFLYLLPMPIDGQIPPQEKDKLEPVGKNTFFKLLFGAFFFSFTGKMMLATDQLTGGGGEGK